MKIEGQHAGYITRQLEEAEKAGFRYVLLEKEKGMEALRPDNLKYYKEKQEANYANYLASSINGKSSEVLPVREVLNDMQKQTALQQIRTQDWSQQPDLTINTNRLRNNENARQQIFTDEIVNKLKSQQIQPDVKQLRENIMQDKQQFVIPGIGKEDGKQKGYNISIEQDANRAFSIKTIAPQQENDRHKSMSVLKQEELLGGRLHKEDAPGVKQMMQAQKEAGNRFVAMENGQQKITGKDFTGFQNAMQAVEFVHQKAKENQNYLFRSTSAVEKEADRVMGNKMELSKEAGKEASHELSEKRSRSAELSR